MKTLSLDLRSAEMLTKSELRQVKGGKTCVCGKNNGTGFHYLGGIEDEQSCLDACIEEAKAYGENPDDVVVL